MVLYVTFCVCNLSCLSDPQPTCSETTRIIQIRFVIELTKNRVATNLEDMENLENSGNLKNCHNLRENSGKFELLQKNPGKLRENEKYVT